MNKPEGNETDRRSAFRPHKKALHDKIAFYRWMVMPNRENRRGHITLLFDSSRWTEFKFLD
jgi:hypothetical protein